MAQDLERRIRQRAYELWEREGRPEGRHLDHWIQASRELASGQDDGGDEQDLAVSPITNPDGLGEASAAKPIASKQRAR